MFNVPSIDEIYLYRESIDFRKGINGLVLLVQEELEIDPFSRSIFVFSNRNKDRVKIIYWDKTGFALWLKRLEKDRFKWPSHLENEKIELSQTDLSLLLSGCIYWDSKPHEAFQYSNIY